MINPTTFKGKVEYPKGTPEVCWTFGAAECRKGQESSEVHMFQQKHLLRSSWLSDRNNLWLEWSPLTVVCFTDNI